MAYASVSFDPDSVASNSDVASSALAAAGAASDTASAASVAAAKGSDASSKIAAKSATWDKASAASSAVATKIANMSEDATPQLGGDLEYNNYNLVFNTTLIANEQYSGDIITVTFGESVTFGQLCYPDPTDNEWKLALATNAAVKHPALGVAVEAKGNGETGKLLLRGLLSSTAFFSTFALGDLLWLSDGTAGSWVNAAPSDSGDIVQHVGWVLAANYAFFNPDYTYIEI